MTHSTRLSTKKPINLSSDIALPKKVVTGTTSSVGESTEDLLSFGDENTSETANKNTSFRGVQGALSSDKPTSLSDMLNQENNAKLQETTRANPGNSGNKGLMLKL